MHNFPPAQFHSDEHVEDTETGGDHDEEVTRYDSLSVVPDERQSALGRIGRTTCGPITKIFPYRAWRHTQA